VKKVMLTGEPAQKTSQTEEFAGPIDPATATLKEELGELLLRLQAPLPTALRETLWAEFESKLRAYARKIAMERDSS